MASFLQTAPDTYTEYIPQFNTQLYAQVGMAKQQQYDQNVEKLQGHVDSVMGLQVSRDVDRKYLEQLQQDMQTNIKSVLGADFSHQQVLNTATSFASRVGNDKNVQNAVFSTINRQKYFEKEKEAKKAGKRSISNDYVSRMPIQQYDQSTELGAVLGDIEYQDYFDWTSEFNKLQKSKKANSFIEQNPTGEGGMLAYSLTESGDKSYISPEEVMQDFQTFLSSNPQAAQQVEIDAIYYADHTPDSVALQQVTANARELENMNREYIKQLSLDKVAHANDPQKSAQYDQAIKTAQASLDNISSEVSQWADIFRTSPTEAKKLAYRDGLGKGLANTYSFSNKYSKQVKNPYGDAVRQEQYRSDQLNLKRQEIGIRRSQVKATERVAQATIDASNLQQGGIPVDNASGGYLNAVEETQKIQEEVIRDRESAFYAALFQTSPELVSEFFEESVPQYQDGQNVSTGTPRLKEGKRVEAEAKMKEWQEAWANGEKVTSILNTHFTNSSIKEKELEARLNSLDRIDQAISTQFGNSPEYRQYQEAIRGLGNLNEPVSTVIVQRARPDGMLEPVEDVVTKGEVLTFLQTSAMLGDSRYLGGDNIYEAVADKIKSWTNSSADEIARASGGRLTSEKAQAIKNEITGGVGLLTIFNDKSISNFYNTLAREAGPALKEVTELQNNMARDFQIAPANVESVIDLSTSGESLNKAKSDDAILTRHINNLSGAVGGKISKEFENLRKEKGIANTTSQERYWITKRADGDFEMTYTSKRGNTSSPIPLSHIVVAEVAPQLLSTDPNSSQKRILLANSTPDNYSSLGGFVPLSKSIYRDTPTRYDIVQMHYAGNTYYIPKVQVNTGGKGWVDLPYDPSAGKEYETVDQAMLYINNLTDSIINLSLNAPE